MYAGIASSDVPLTFLWTLSRTSPVDDPRSGLPANGCVPRMLQRGQFLQVLCRIDRPKLRLHRSLRKPSGSGMSKFGGVCSIDAEEDRAGVVVK